MDTIAFNDTGEEIGVRISINGRDFIEMVREVELPLATHEGAPGLAGAYLYFGPVPTFLPSRHFRGEPACDDWSDGQGRCYLLSCTCGWPGCWPLSARIEVREREVVWSDFRQPHRGPDSDRAEWRYDGFGPFIFERAAYECALAGQPVPRKAAPRERTENTPLAEVFNVAFRRGANDRAAAGFAPSGEAPSLADIPPVPAEHADTMTAKAWVAGYRAGYGCGASEAELASVDIPGAHGMISGFDQEFLERYGFLKS
jgi:hypothetical protein